MQVEPESEAAAGTIIRTFLIADVRGYTLFTAERGDEAAARLASRFAALAREGVETSGGAVIELRGDEALAVFDSPRQAIRAAVQLQRRFVDETVADPTLPLAVGIGLDAGEAVPVEDGYRGGALNLAARLCGLAGPAEILASREVVHLARKVEGVAYVDRGPVQLKGLGDPVHVMRLRAEAEDAAEDMAFRRALGPLAARLVPVVPGAITPNPYKGLRAFEEGDAPDFFGREALTDQLVDLLGDSRFLAVVGPSGSGKSSVVRAGLIPALRRGAIPGSSEWRIAEMFPGAHPLEELEAALLRVAENPPATLMEQLQGDHGLLRAAKRALPADGSELLLVIDQFEEVFTLVEDEAVRTHFLESVEEAVADPHGRLRVVITLRADFYDRPLLYRGFGELLLSRVEGLVPMSPEELERAISGPASRVDVRLEHGLGAKMVADVADQPGGLPLLQYALTELFERREDSILSLDAYTAIGGVSGALGRRAEELYQDLDADGKEAARQLFLRLVTLGEGAEDTRRPVPRSELASLDVDQKAMAGVIDSFGASRLLSFDRDSRTGAPTVEVAHEALLTAWGRFRRWIDEAREDLRTERRLAAAARDWLEADRDSSFLVGGSRLDQFEAWRQGSRISITPEEREFLETSMAERDRRQQEEEARQARERELERRSVRRLRTVVAVLTAAALIAAGLTVFAFNQRDRAEREERVAVARELAAAADASLEADPERSILLALEAVRRTRSTDGSVLPEAEEALHRAVLASRVVLTIPDAGGRVDWSPDGTRFAAEGSKATTVDIRDAKTGESVASFHGHAVDVTGLTFSADGSTLATTGDDGTVRVWDPESGERLRSFGRSATTVGTFQGPAGPAHGPSFSSDGSLVAAAWPIGGKPYPLAGTGEVRIGNVATGRTVRRLSVPLPAGTAFSPDGKRLAVVLIDRPMAVVVDLSSEKRVLTLGGHRSSVHDVAWSPDGRWVATVSADTTIRIWEADTGDLRFTLFGHTGPVQDADWSEDSTRLVTGSADGTAKVWEISERGAREVLSLSARETTGGIAGVAFSPDGDRVLAGGLGTRALKIWDVGTEGDAEWRNIPANPAGLTSVAFSPDGRLVVSRRNGSVSFLDPESGRQLQTVDRQGSEPLFGPVINAIEVSPDGHLVATASGSIAQALDIATGEEDFGYVALGGIVDAPVSLTEARVEDVAWSPDGTHLALALGGQNSAQLVNRSGPVRTLRGTPGLSVIAVRFSPDGRLLATAARPRRANPASPRVALWDWRSGEVVGTPLETSAEAVAFDPDGTRLATAGPGGAAIWDLNRRERVVALAGGTGGLLDIAYSPDGSLIAAAGNDATIRLWDAVSGAQVLVLRGHRNVVSDVAFSADGSKLASAGGEGIVRVWALDLDDLIGIAEGELTRD